MNGRKKGALLCCVALAFYTAAIFSFLNGREDITMYIVLGTIFLCIGVIRSKQKGQDAENGRSDDAKDE